MEKNKTAAPAAEKTAANDVRSMNVYQKLILARTRFLARNIKKSGINRKLEFQYFELADIVPPATRIFQNVGLLGVVNFSTPAAKPDAIPDAPAATMVIVNTDDPSETIEFTVPYREVEQIVSNSGKVVTNPLQALGSSVTYLRRYLWMLALDIVEQDDVDPMLGNDDTPTLSDKAPDAAHGAKPTRPATPAERESTKVTLTQPDGPADELMIKGLREALKKLRQKDERNEEFVQQVAEKTKGFTKLTRTQCEELVKKVQAMIAEYDKC